MSKPLPNDRIETPHGHALAVTGAQLQAVPAWRECFAKQRKDHRYYELIERTLPQDFEYFYLVLADREGRVRSVQPGFLVKQDILAGLGEGARNIVAQIGRAHV